jgi:NDP-sugar pyrophosphorylase family protein
MLMRALLICPAERSAVALLPGQMPLACMPLLGQSLLEYWLSDLASRGLSQVVILAHDRPELAVELVANGERWGLVVSVINESRELTIAEALLKYSA